MKACGDLNLFEYEDMAPHYALTLQRWAETFETKEGEDFELRQPAGMTITVEEISAEQAVISYVPENASEPVKQVKKLSSPPKGQ